MDFNINEYEDNNCYDKNINNYKKNTKKVNYKKLNLRYKDSIHAHKNMRKQNKDWKDFNLQ